MNEFVELVVTLLIREKLVVDNTENLELNIEGYSKPRTIRSEAR